jgi:hypothetical protein
MPFSSPDYTSVLWRGVMHRIKGIRPGLCGNGHLTGDCLSARRCMSE